LFKGLTLPNLDSLVSASAQRTIDGALVRRALSTDPVQALRME
jgi:hypothetical protein